MLWCQFGKFHRDTDKSFDAKRALEEALRDAMEAEKENLHCNFADQLALRLSDLEDGSIDNC